MTCIVTFFSSSSSHILIHLLFHLLFFFSSHSKSARISVSFVQHTHRSSSYFHSISLEPLTGRHPPLTINITLALTLPLAYFYFWVDSSLVHTVVIAHSCRNHSSNISWIIFKSLIPRISVILHSKHSHSFLINIHKHSKFTSSHTLFTYMIASYPPSRLISNLHQACSSTARYQILGSLHTANPQYISPPFSRMNSIKIHLSIAHSIPFLLPLAICQIRHIHVGTMPVLHIHTSAC